MLVPFKPVPLQKMDNHSQDVGLKPELIAGTNPRPEGRGNGALLPGRQLVLKIHCPVL
jgi:hypothetical protein